MHYAFKVDLNKLDSNQNRNVSIPEVDFLFNRALILYVNNIFFPRDSRIPGFESTQRSIDNLRTLVVPGEFLPVSNKLVPYPQDYWHFIKARALVRRGNCSKEIRLFPQQHDDLVEENSIYKSDFDWETLNFTYTSPGLKLEYSGFEVEEVKMGYVRKHPYMHNAEDYDPDGYESLHSGNLLTGHQNCELPDDSCEDIVQIAVFLASGAIQDQVYSAIKEKLTFNQTT